jgi:hypothetical protein
MVVVVVMLVPTTGDLVIDGNDGGHALGRLSWGSHLAVHCWGSITGIIYWLSIWVLGSFGRMLSLLSFCERVSIYWKSWNRRKTEKSGRTQASAYTAARLDTKRRQISPLSRFTSLYLLLATSSTVVTAVTGSFVYEGSCSTDYTSSSLCASTVTYPFYLPPLINISALDAMVSERFLASNLGVLLPNKCQYSLLQLLCVSIFVRCPTGFTQAIVQLSSLAEQADVTPLAQTQVQISVPQVTLHTHDFDRPCVALCSQVNARCFEFMDLGMLGSNLLCSNIRSNSSASLTSSTVLNVGSVFTFSDVNATCYGQEIATKISRMSAVSDVHRTLSRNRDLPKTASVTARPEVIQESTDDGYNSTTSSSVVIEPLITDNNFCSEFFSDTGVYNIPNPLGYFGRSLTELSSVHSNQQQIFETFTEISDTLPRWVSADCRFALRRYVCSSAFVAPRTLSFTEFLSGSVVVSDDDVTFSSSSSSAYSSLLLSYWQASGINESTLLDADIRAPTYGDRKICDSYVSVCGKMLSRLPSYKPTLSPAIISLLTPPRCDALDNVTNLYLFPNASQVVARIQLAVNSSSAVLSQGRKLLSSSGNTVDSYFNVQQLSSTNRSYVSVLLSTPPNTAPLSATVTDDQSGYEGLCPHGFVIPEDPSDSRVQWVSGTGCAVACL